MAEEKELRHANHPWTVKVVTLFPEMFPGTLGHSLVGKALKKDLWSLDIINLREFASDERKTVDGRPAGGGAGLVLRADVLDRAIRHIKSSSSYIRQEWPIIALSPRGKVFDQEMAASFSKCKGVILICGRYEGFDERILEFHQIPEISIGDFIISGGEIAAQALIDSTVRLIPHVVGNQNSLLEESFSEGLLEYPHYTSPRIWQNLPIPDELLSGNHKNIRQWRNKKSEEITKIRRPDMWVKYQRLKNT